jgi:transmembrane sensor
MNIRNLVQGWRYRTAARRFISSGARQRAPDARYQSKESALIESIWALSSTLKGDPAVDYLKEPPRGFHRSERRHLYAVSTAAAATLLIGISVYVLATSTNVWYSTGIGEQKTLMLPDGSSMFLNTATAVRVEYRPFHRIIRLQAGEAAFNVTKSRIRPFEVITPLGSARAVGTKFDVFARPTAMEVAIVQGIVAVGSAEPVASRGGVVVHSGQLATIMADTSILVGTADIARIVEHRVERLEFDNVPLADVVAEFNRYSKTPVLAQSAAVSARKISGVFQVGDSAGLAASLAASLQLRSIDTPNAIVLAGRPLQ